MTENAVHRDPVEQLAEEFMARLRRGERPAVSEYAAAHPDLADEIRDLFPALAVLEEVKPAGTDPHATDPDPAAPPEQVGDYRILREVARGGMGVVYEAEQVALGRHVALKVLPARSGGDPLRLLRFRREARSAARLHHTNIVPVFDVGIAGGVHYYAMQFIRGQGLDEVLQELRRLRAGGKPTAAANADLTASLADGLRTGVFPAAPIVPVPGSAGPRSETSAILTGPVGRYFRSVAGLAAQAADALAYAHGQRVLHRDVKPSNLLLDRGGTLWLTDFGLAKDDGDDLTRTGDLVGTLRYMAPERFQGVSDPRSDVYALGVTLYELLTLRPAFEESDRALLVRRIVHDDPPPPRAVDPTVPRDLETIVLKAIEKDPARRYPTAADMADDLRRFLADRPVRARRASWREQGWRWCRRNRAVAASLAAAFLTLLAGVVTSAWLAVRATRAEAAAENRLGKEVEANREARLRLFDARRAEARASRFSRRPGQRYNSLAALTEAVALARELGLGDDVLAALRDEAVAALALPDVRPVPVVVGEIHSGGAAASLDADLAHYARNDGGGVVRVRRTADGRVLSTLPPPAGFTGVQDTLIGDGGALAVSYKTPDRPADAACVVWDWPTAKERFRLPFPIVPTAFAFAPDGRELAVGQADGTLTVHDAATGREVRRAKLEGAIERLAVHASGKVAAHGAGGVRVYDPAAGAVTFHRPGVSAYHLAWHPDGRLLAAGGQEDAFVWDTHPAAAGRPPVVMRGHQHHVYRVAFSPDGELLLTKGSDATSRLWDPWLGTELLRVPGELGQFDRTGRRVGWVRGSTQAVVYEAALGAEYRTLPGSPIGVGDGTGAVSGSGRWLAVSGIGVHVWDLATDRRLFRLGGYDNPNFRGDDELVVRGAGGVCRWPLQLDGDVLRARPPSFRSIAAAGPPTYQPQLRLPPGGRHLAVGGRPGFVLDLAAPDRPAPLAGDATHANISPDGRWAVASGQRMHSPLRVWRLPAAEPVRTLYADQPVGHITTAFTADSRRMLAIGGGFVELWATDSWVSLWRRQGDPSSQARTTAALSPDGRLVAAVLSSATVHLLDAATGRTLARLETPDGDPIGWLGFGLGGDRLVTSTDRAGVVRAWDIRRTREQLRELGLDWGPADAPPPPARRVRVEFDPRLGQAERLFQQARDHDQAGRPAEAVAEYTQALDRNPALGAARAARGALLARRGDWPAAAADLLAAPATPASDRGAQAACLLRLTGDEAGYARVRAAAVAEGRAAREALEGPRYDACRVYTLAPGGAEAAEVAGWAEGALEPNPSPWRLHVLARALLRAGKLEDAVKRAEQSLKAGPDWPGRPLNWLVSALADHHRGRTDAARNWLATAATWRDGLAKDVATGRPLCPTGQHLTDWLEIHVLLAEAERLLPKPDRK